MEGRDRLEWPRGVAAVLPFAARLESDFALLARSIYGPASAVLQELQQTVAVSSRACCCKMLVAHAFSNRSDQRLWHYIFNCTQTRLSVALLHSSSGVIRQPFGHFVVCILILDCHVCSPTMHRGEVSLHDNSQGLCNVKLLVYGSCCISRTVLHLQSSKHIRRRNR